MAAMWKRDQFTLPAETGRMPGLVDLRLAVLGFFAFTYHAHGLPIVNGEIPWAIVILGSVLFTTIQIALSVGLSKPRKFRSNAVAAALALSAICSLTIMRSAISFVNEWPDQKTVTEIVKLESLLKVPSEDDSSSFYLLLSVPPRQIKAGIQGTHPSLKISPLQYNYLRILGATHGSQLQIIEVPGLLGFPFVISSDLIP